MTSSPRLSRFLDLVTLRSRHSWTSWRRKVLERKWTRERRRLDRALEMVALQQGRLVLVEQELHPLLPHPQLVIPRPSAPPPQDLVERFNPSPGLSLAPVMELPERLPNLQPTQDDLLLGLAPSPTSSPSSES